MKITNRLLFVVGATMAGTMNADTPAEGGGPIAQTITLVATSRPTHAGAIVAPTSQLTRDQAFALAAALSKINGKDIIIGTVTPTGSMRPYFDENALLLLEAVPFSELRLGDVVTFSHPRLQIDVVHRLVEKRGNTFWAKGDNNAAMDNVYVTAENFHRRLVGIIYIKPENAAQSGASVAASNLTSSPPPAATRKPGE